MPKLLHTSIVLIILISTLINAVYAGRNFYEVLGVSKDATKRQIKKAYRELSLKYHPDKNKGDDKAHERFVEVSNAYQVLSDSKQKRIYDQYGEDGLKKAQQPHQDPFDLFQQFGFGGFGGGGFHSQNSGGIPKGADTYVPLRVSLEELYNGGMIRTLHRKQILCTKCRGTGAKNPDDVRACPVCGGSGMIIRKHTIGPGFVQHVQSPCDRCGGKGKIIGARCHVCRGTKVATGEEHMMVFLEKGMEDGQKIVIDGQGDVDSDHEAGDVIFIVQTDPHPVFQRDGDDLNTRIHISLSEALVGFKRDIKHLDGHTVKIIRDGVTKPLSKETIENEGMPKHEFNSDTGDLIVTYWVEFPDRLSERQVGGIKALLSGV